DAPVGDRLAVLLGGDRAEQRVVRGEDEGVLVAADGLERGERAARAESVRAAEGERDEREHADRDPEAQQAVQAAALLRLRPRPLRTPPEQRVEVRVAWALGGPAHQPITPPARSASAACSRSSRWSRSAAGS